jgi:hypothetical protein
MISQQRPLGIIYNTISLTNSALLTADTSLLRTKNPCLIHDSRSPFHRKMYNCLLVRCHVYPIWLLLPLYVTFTLLLLFQVSWVNLSYIEFIRSMYQTRVGLVIQRIRPSPRCSVTFRKKTILVTARSCLTNTQLRSWTTTPCRLCATDS